MTGPSLEVIEALVAFGRKREAVEKWTQEKAYTFLQGHMRDVQISLNRAAVKANQQDAAVSTAPRPGGSQLERDIAAAFLEQTSRPDDIGQTIWAVTWCLSDSETVRVKRGLINLLRSTATVTGGPETAGNAAGAPAVPTLPDTT